MYDSDSDSLLGLFSEGPVNYHCQLSVLHASASASDLIFSSLFLNFVTGVC